MEAKIYNQKGKEAGSMKLPEHMFDVPWNADLVHQVITSMQSSARAGTAQPKWTALFSLLLQLTA